MIEDKISITPFISKCMTSVVALVKPEREANTELIKMLSKWVISNNFFQKKGYFRGFIYEIPRIVF